MYGENQAEYGNNSSENDEPTMDRAFFSAPSADELKLGGMSVTDIMKKHDYSLNDFTPYMPVSAGELDAGKVVVHYLGYYLKWDPQECYYYAVDHTGFQPNTERTQGSYSKYSSIDDKIDPFHYFTTLIKFGLGRASYDAAQEIRNSKITRGEGVELVRKYDQEFPDRYYAEFLDYIGLTEDEFWATVDRRRSPHLWAKDSDTWKLKHTVFDP
jgi:hypothetical protein